MNPVEQLVENVTSVPAVRRAFDDLRERREAYLCGLTCSAKAMAIARLHQETALPVLVVVPDQEEAEALLGDLEICLGEERIFFFAETEVIPYDHRSPHVGLLGERIPALAALNRSEPLVTITTARALAGRIVRPADFESFRLPLRVGAEVAFEDLPGKLAARGFRRERLVEEIGTFAVRGGLVDLYPFGNRYPVRVEFFGDEIESIRLFDPATQRTREEVPGLDVLPQRELLLSEDTIARARERGDLPFDEGSDPFVDGVEFYLPRFHENPGSLLEYFPSGGLVVLDEPQRLEEKVDETLSAATAGFKDLTSRGHDVPEPGELFLDPTSLAADLAHRPVLRLALFRTETSLGALRSDRGPIPVDRIHRIQITSQETFRGNFSVLRERLRTSLDGGSSIHLLCDNRGQASRLEEMLEDLSERIHLSVAPLRNGFSVPELDLVVLTDHELFARSARRYRAFRYGGGAPIHDYSSLKKGDFVVHMDHGIGRYGGIQHLKTGGVETECLVIRYQEDALVYVPIDQINLVQKYIGGEAGEAPVIARLGSIQWEKAKARVKKAVEKMAAQLLDIHAARAAKKGHAFSPDGEWQREMEASFIYEETPDQRTATDAAKKDMMEAKPMDRLICGDVGYGKTEVAIRAAFKAVTDGKQVAVLVPTTILAQQHFNTFRERLRAYPVTIDLLSRFRDPRAQKTTVRAIGEGSVDILIGTHRILSKDVSFRDLGLVIVDEEQRFGVRHKERLKEMRKLVDVLTLTATPIPRTLNMALMGLRDISVIDTPPPNKLPIVTEVVEASDDLIRKAILREVQRGGQIFFVHNRVRSIELVSGRLRELLPELRFDVAHGQMPERDLERVMLDFLERRSDVLVSTMIIESGLDLPNVNTILINRADAFGLAQLYQLRGRVGRSNHRAFAHLLIPEGKSLSEVARKRLRAIEEFSDLGSGFRLAMRDMEIRGAGNFLGPEQSGHVSAIGYDLYCQMLRETIAQMKGEERPLERYPVEMDVELAAFLPADYIEDPDQRILFYKRLADLAEVRGLSRFSEELRDRYGRLPEAASNLISLKELRLLAEASGVEKFGVRGAEATFRFREDRSPGAETVKALVQATPAELSFQADSREGLRIRLRAASEGETFGAVEALLRAACASDSFIMSNTAS